MTGTGWPFARTRRRRALAVRAVGLAAITLVTWACGAQLTTRPPAVAPDVDRRLSSADALLHVGCFDCLVDALAADDELNLRLAPSSPAADAAATGVIRAALRLELRARELGLGHAGYLPHARHLVESRPEWAAAFDPLIRAVEAVAHQALELNIWIRRHGRGVRRFSSCRPTLRSGKLGPITTRSPPTSRPSSPVRAFRVRPSRPIQCRRRADARISTPRISSRDRGSRESVDRRVAEPRRSPSVFRT